MNALKSNIVNDLELHLLFLTFKYEEIILSLDNDEQVVKPDGTDLCSIIEDNDEWTSIHIINSFWLLLDDMDECSLFTYFNELTIPEIIKQFGISNRIIINFYFHTFHFDDLRRP